MQDSLPESETYQKQAQQEPILTKSHVPAMKILFSRLKSSSAQRSIQEERNGAMQGAEEADSLHLRGVWPGRAGSCARKG